MFSTSKGHTPLSLNMPFRVVRVTNKECLYGRDRHKVQQNTEDTVPPVLNEWSTSTFAKKKIKLQGTKKKGCTAMLQAKVVEVFTSYRVSSTSFDHH